MKELYFLPSKPQKRGEFISGWRVHKRRADKKSKRMTKVEQYVYLSKEDLPKLLKFLDTGAFEYTTDPNLYPSIYNVLRALEGKTHNAQLKPAMSNEHEYRTHFTRVLLHRNTPYLVRVYECISNPNGSVKLEISYLDKKPNDKRRIKGTRNPLHKLCAMEEIKRRIDRRFPIDPSSSFIDHSKGMPLSTFVKKLNSYAERHTPDVHRRMQRCMKKLLSLISP